MKQVALLIETSNAFSRELLQGIRDWLRAHGGWTLHLTEQGRGNRPPRWLKDWTGEGIIARVETQAIAAAVRSRQVPVVNVSASEAGMEFPTVMSDSAAIARTAAEHLIQRGFRNLAFCGDGRFDWSRRHGENFAAACQAWNLPCHIFPTRGVEQEQPRIRQWLAGLPRPVGVMACYDIRGQQVLDAGRALGARIPEEIAVIGQHNDELLCDLCDPPLSSVIPGARQAGYTAAQWLEQLMRGRPTGPTQKEIPPLGVATRQSTDTIAVADPGLAAAMRHLRAHALEPVSVDHLARIAGLSRTALERRFREHFHVSPYEQILRIRIQHADQLLTTTNLPVPEVAEKCGFSTLEHFTATFSRRTGTPPATRRRQSNR